MEQRERDNFAKAADMQARQKHLRREKLIKIQ